jgi:hypothetical protein
MVLIESQQRHSGRSAAASPESMNTVVAGSAGKMLFSVSAGPCLWIPGSPLRDAPE